MPEQVAGEDHVVPGGTEDADAYFYQGGFAFPGLLAIDPRTNKRELPNQAAAVESGYMVERRPTNKEHYPTWCFFLRVSHFSLVRPR
jgi:hypothetical protein